MFGELIPDFLKRRPTERRPDMFSVDEVRNARVKLTNEEWVKRIVRERMDFNVEAPEAFKFNHPLMEDLAAVPPEGARLARQSDTPPPPLREDGVVTVPERIYSNGVVWKVGKQIGGGKFGSVFEVSVDGVRSEKKRVVKIMVVKDNSKLRGALWSEVGVAMLTGDFVGSEVMQEDGETWAALVLEKHEGKDAWKYIKTKESNELENEFVPDPKVAFQIAVMIRSVVHTLRRMHAAGWIHRDVKPANIIFNTQEGEEFLSRLIDFGIARRSGNVRGEAGKTLQGTPRFAFPEATLGADIDLRMRDYWGVMITAAIAIGLISETARDGTLEDCFDRLQCGRMYVAPQLDIPIRADAFFGKHEQSEAQKNFLKWMFGFLRPTDDITSRRKAWRDSGITKKLPVDQIPSGLASIEFTEDDMGLGAAFLDDDKFVRELEGHIRALGAQIGRTDVDRALALLQEFPTP